MSNIAPLARTFRGRLFPFVIGALLSMTMTATAQAERNVTVQRCRMTVGRRIG